MRVDSRERASPPPQVPPLLTCSLPRPVNPFLPLFPPGPQQNTDLLRWQLHMHGAGGRTLRGQDGSGLAHADGDPAAARRAGEQERPWRVRIEPAAAAAGFGRVKGDDEASKGSRRSPPGLLLKPPARFSRDRRNDSRASRTSCRSPVISNTAEATRRRSDGDTPPTDWLVGEEGGLPPCGSADALVPKHVGLTKRPVFLRCFRYVCACIWKHRLYGQRTRISPLIGRRAPYKGRA